MKTILAALAFPALWLALPALVQAQAPQAIGPRAVAPAAVAPATGGRDPQWLRTLMLHTRVCRAVCGDDFVGAKPEMRDHLTCLDGTMRPVGSSPARSACTRFDRGPWAEQRGGAWCIKVYPDVGRSDWTEPAQCAGLVPLADIGKARPGPDGHVAPR